jgi:hypothetical protein
MRTATKASVTGAIALSAAFLVGPVGASSANADLNAQKKAKRCATTGAYVKPGSTKPRNSGKNNPGKVFKERSGQDSGDQERNTGETANLGGFAATVTSASFVHLCLQARAQRDELGSIAHQLAQLSRRRRCDPRLRQAAQAKQVREVPGVALVVLDPPVAPVVARRVRQMHPMPIGLEQVHRPVPPASPPGEARTKPVSRWPASSSRSSTTACATARSAAWPTETRRERSDTTTGELADRHDPPLGRGRGM